MKLLFAGVFVLSLALIAQGQQLPSYPIVKAPVIIVSPIGFELTCPACYQQQPLKYYAGGPSARWEVQIHPWYRIDAPDWVTCLSDATDPLKAWCETTPNDSGSYRSGSIQIGDAAFAITQEPK